jgi:hypothetical protein
MANRFAVASGNFNATSTWATTAAGSPGASVPVVGDNAIANNRTVTITADATCDNITNGTAYGGTAGGGFVLNDSVTLTTAVISGTVSGSCVTYSGSIAASLVGAVTGGGGTTAIGVTHSGTGIFNVTNAASHTGRAFANTYGGTISINGNCTATVGGGSTPLITNSASGTITVNGNLAGGSGGASHCISNTNNGAVNVTGSVTGGSVSGAFGINNPSTGTVTVNSGTITATIANAIVSTSATVRVSGNFIYASDGTIPVSAPKIILLTTPIASKTRYALNSEGTFVDMFTADNTGLGPATNHVRSGVTYNGMTGTLAVPLPSQVAVGVATDNTVGTAFVTGSDIATAVWGAASRTITEGGITAADVWSHATRTITGGTVTTLTNAPTVPSAAAIAAQVRTELSVELGRVDATVSSRLAGSAYTAPSTAPTAAANASAVRTELATELARVDVATSTRLASSAYTAPSNSDVTAIKAKTDLLETTRLAQCSTVATTGAQLAAALS